METATSLARASATLVATVASFLSVYALSRAFEARGDVAILSAMLALALARRAHPLSWSRAIVAPVTIAGTALAATGAAMLLHAVPALGALVFIAIVALSVWLRNFGERAKNIGSSLAAPLVALLIVPVRPSAPGGPVVDIGLVVCAGVIALAYVTGVAWLARRFGLVAGAPEHAPATASDVRPRAGLPVPTRMALQMAVALAAAFGLGFALFPGHYGWTVLTAFIVCSGARGRGDAAYKGVLRLVGAVAGTLFAAAFAVVAAPSGITLATLVFCVLFIGVWLRDRNYAYWAACMTLVLALLSPPGSAATIALLGVRLEAIFIGALCAVASAWFVYPIRTRDVVRRRLATALEALDRVVAVGASELATFEFHMRELESVAAPHRWHRRLFAATARAEHPAEWIALAHDVARLARRFDVPEAFDNDRDQQRGTVRRAIGASRRAIGTHGKADALPVGVALRNLRDALQPAEPIAKAE